MSDFLFQGGSGSFETGRRKRRAQRELPIMKALAFNAPYWTMTFRNLLLLGDDINFKTRNQAWSHRGPLLAYTNSRRHQVPIDAYGFSDNEIPQQAIVGCVHLGNVCLLEEGDKLELLKCYNNAWTKRQIEQALRGPHISAMDWGYAIDDAHQFPEPVFLKKWPSTGPI